MTDLQTRADHDAEAAQPRGPDVDVVVVGAGIAGLYLVKRLRDQGFDARAFDTAHDVGGTWYWNRYPGARCDVESIDYQYTWDADLTDEWTWSERYATQPEILRYINHVADKHDLRRDITFETRMVDARWDDASAVWTVRTEPVDGGRGEVEDITCRWYIMATGCLSAPKDPDIAGADAFAGEVYVTGRWPHEGVDFTGKRVAVIGTGSSAIQSIPLIAEQADELVVFQRTPNFSIPARNGPPRPDKVQEFEGRTREYREEARWSTAGVPREVAEFGALMVDDETRAARYEQAWEEGTIFSLIGAFNDLLANPDSNDTAAEFVRSKIRSTVDDPETADALCPTTYPIGTKRLCLDTNYYSTFNSDHVSLVDLRAEPIRSITADGLQVGPVGSDDPGRSFEFDAIVFATGFDAMTGAIVRVDIEGRDGVSLREKWADGPHTYLGLMTHGFPNLFMVTGPQSPSVLSNMAVSIEQHVEWITDTLGDLREAGHDVIEPTELAERSWVRHNDDFAGITLFPQANSWYMGANVPGKARAVLPYIGGVDRYRQACVDVVDSGYLGFRRDSSTDEAPEVVNDGIIRPLAPDVAVMLEMMAELGVPAVETLSPTEARAFMQTSAELSPPGPDVGEVTNGVFPGADGDLIYRRYVPVGSSDTPLPLVLYFHGGGWVLGDATSDDAFCRDMCNRTGAVVVSCDYRHAPEHRFPAAHDDAWAALCWAAENTAQLGGDSARIAVAGWSAGANLAGYICQRARDDSGPGIVAQLLVTPVTDHEMSSPSYTDNAEGYVLTSELMAWFMNHYADETERADPRLALLRADDLSGLAPAVVVTAEFDPLRDEGAAYADALRDAGGSVVHLRAGGQIHTSMTAVGALLTPADVREEAFSELAALLG